MRRRRLSEEDRRRLVVTQGDLTALSKHPAWATLEVEIDKREQRLQKMVLAKALNTTAGVSLEEQAYLRGYIHGMRWFAAVPPTAGASLERFLREQGIQVEEVTSEA